jgi:hypothetical protein
MRESAVTEFVRAKSMRRNRWLVDAISAHKAGRVASLEHARVPGTRDLCRQRNKMMVVAGGDISRRYSGFVG